MRFTCDTNDLNTALSIVSRALAVRSTKPILEGILFESCDEGLRLTCTDLALGIETCCPRRSARRSAPFCRVNCSAKSSASCREAMRRHGRRADASDDSLRAFARRSTVSIRWNILNCRKWRAQALNCPNTLKDMVGRTLFAIARDESRPILTGCLMEISQTG
ncbi:MAG: hypothetical protein ACLS6G_14745 [Christensenellales bacterium]